MLTLNSTLKSGATPDYTVWGAVAPSHGKRGSANL